MYRSYEILPDGTNLTLFQKKVSVRSENLIDEKPRGEKKTPMEKRSIPVVNQSWRMGHRSALNYIILPIQSAFSRKIQKL